MYLKHVGLQIRDTIGEINIYSGGTLRALKYLFMSYGDNRDPGGFVNMIGTGKVVYTASQANYFGRFPRPEDPLTGVYSRIPYPPWKSSSTIMTSYGSY